MDQRITETLNRIRHVCRETYSTNTFISCVCNDVVILRNKLKAQETFIKKLLRRKQG